MFIFGDVKFGLEKRTEKFTMTKIKYSECRKEFPLNTYVVVLGRRTESQKEEFAIRDSSVVFVLRKVMQCIILILIFIEKLKLKTLNVKCLKIHLAYFIPTSNTEIIIPYIKIN